MVLFINGYKVVKFKSVDEISQNVSIQMKRPLRGTFLWCCLSVLYKAVLTFESVGKILNCDHSNKSY